MSSYLSRYGLRTLVGSSNTRLILRMTREGNVTKRAMPLDAQTTAVRYDLKRPKT